MTESEIEELRAAARLFKSRRVRNLAILLGGLLWSVILAAGGWIAGKIDSSGEIRGLNEALKTLNGSVVILSSRHDALAQEIHSMTDKDGRFTIIDSELESLHLGVVMTTVACYANESASSRSRKQAEADKFEKAFLNLRNQGNRASAARTSLLTKVAIQ